MIKIDFSFYIAILLALFSGQMDVYLTYLIALVIHECGHLLLATLFKWEIETLKVSAIGGFLNFKNDLSKPAGEIIVVATGGILLNVITGAVILHIDGPPSLIYAQFAIGIFNLLPIAPLDGSKILEGIMRLFMTYHLVLKVMGILNLFFYGLFVLFITIFRLEQYLLVAVVLAVLIWKFRRAKPYVNQRYLIQKGN